MPVPAYPTVDSQGVPIKVPRQIQEGAQVSNVIQQFDSGHEQRRKKASPRLTWEFTYEILPQASYDVLFQFYLARSGPCESFTWVHPITKLQYLVRFNSDTWQAENVAKTLKLGNIWKLSVKLIQVF